MVRKRCFGSEWTEITEFASLILMNSENYGSIPSEIIPSALITLGVLLLNLFTRIHPILLICAAGLAGYLIF